MSCADDTSVLTTLALPMSVGRKFGEFVVRRRLGQGGGGEVYLAEQVSLGREAVIKVMLAGARSPSASERFLREARLASQFDHPFAAHVYDFGSEPDGTLWIAMELVRGTPLDVVLRQGPVPLPRFVPFFERLCEVVHAGHEQGIVHRDIKPANVMVLNRAGRLLPKLLDFGVARKGEQLGDETVAAPLNASPFANATDQADGLKTLSETLANQLVKAESTQITQVGVLLGTPQYMAPEQWLDASHVDARADIYSLSLLAFQAISGIIPFTGRSLSALVRAHGKDALPELPPELPRPLRAVLEKGAAKSADDRYPSALELGAAFRAASGVGDEAISLPTLETSLRENLLSEAPQPIAESVAYLESARSIRQQLEAARMVRVVVIRYMAAIALAARGRVGPGAPTDDPGVIEAVMKLAKSGLTTQEWLALTSALCRPFALKRAAYPVPELVGFFFDDSSELMPGPGSLALSRLDAIALPEKEASDEMVYAALMKVMPALSSLLQQTSFLFDYSLVIANEAPERWMGTRRPRRSIQSPVRPPTPQHAPILVDAVGLTVLSLAPLLQVLTPGVGMADELFFLDGAGRHGARLIALPAAFERQSPDVWAWVSANLFEVSESRAAVASVLRTPYKGLSTFTPDDADDYFGREKEAETFANRLQNTPLLAVIGPSGSGKSSFVLAGVLPLLPKGWRVAVARPGPSPFQALMSKLSAMELKPDARSLGDSLAAALGEHEALLLVIDQFEELISLCPDPSMREAFAQALVDVASHPSGRIRVVLTLRDDFLIRVQQLTALRDHMSGALQLLGTPQKQDLLRVVTEPARRVGFTFDDESLPSRMVEEVADYPGALALLSFAASQLWSLRDRHLRQMRAKVYTELGGVGGALAHHAEETLAGLTAEGQGLVREAFRQLVTSHGTRAVVSKREILELLGGSATAAAMIEKLITARLLVTSDEAGRDDRIEIIHEALIVSWPRLVTWQKEDAETARLRDSLRASARQWEERGRPSGVLWRKETLAEYRIWRSRFPGRLTSSEEAFANASLSAERRSTRVQQALALTVFAGLVTGLVLLNRSNEASKANAALATRRAGEAQQRLADLRVEQARVAALDDKPFHTLLYAKEGRAQGASGTTIDYLESRARAKLEGQLSRVSLGAGAALMASPSAKTIAALGPTGEVKLIGVSASSFSIISSVAAKGGEQASFSFFADGHSGVLCQNSGEISVIDDDGRPPRVVVQVKGVIDACALSPNGQTLVALESGQRLHLWAFDPAGVSAHRTLELGTNHLALTFSPDSRTLVTYHTRKSGMAARDWFATLVNVEKGQATARLPCGYERCTTGAFSRDGKFVALGGYTSLAGLFSTRDGRRVATLRGHFDFVQELHFSPNGQLVISSSTDRTARIWKTDGTLVSTLTHTAPVSNARFIDDSHVLTAAADGVVRRWTVGLATSSSDFFAHAAAVTGFVTLDADRFVTIARDGMLRLWSLERATTSEQFAVPSTSFVVPAADAPWAISGPDYGVFVRWDLKANRIIDQMKVTGCDRARVFAFTSEPMPLVASSDNEVVCLMRWAAEASATRLSGHHGNIKRLAFSRDGRLLATSSNDHTVMVWSTETHARLLELTHAAPVQGLTFSSDGRHLITGSADGVVHDWSMPEGREARQWRAHTGALTEVVLNRSDTRLVTSSTDQATAVWSFESGQLERRFAGHTEIVSSGRPSFDEKLLLTSDESGVMLIWDIDRAVPIDRLSAGGSTNDVQWSAERTLITVLGSLPLLETFRLTSDQPEDPCANPWVFENQLIVPRSTWPPECTQ